MGEGDRVAVITGASSGIGKEAAKALAAEGYRVIGTGRDPERMAAAQREIEAAGQGRPMTMLAADLSLIAEAERLAAEIAALTDRIDLLLNNAGGMTDRLVMTSERLEANFAGNHLGPFVLTQRLLPLLHVAAANRPAGSVRILMTGSEVGEWIAGIDFNTIERPCNFDPVQVYFAGKLANLLFAKGLAERLKGSGIVAHVMAPGAVESNFLNNAGAQVQKQAQGMARKTAAEGADTLIWLATGEEAARSSGGYWQDRAPRQPNPVAEDVSVIESFWRESDRLVASTTVNRICSSEWSMPAISGASVLV